MLVDALIIVGVYLAQRMFRGYMDKDEYQVNVFWTHATETRKGGWRKYTSFQLDMQPTSSERSR